MIKTKDLSYKYKEGNIGLKDINLEFSRGEIISIKNAFNSLSPVSCETTEGYFCDSQGNCCDSELNCGSLGLVDKG